MARCRLFILAIFITLRLFTAASSEENRFRLLHANHEAAQARADAIRSAASSIETTYYWIGDDRVGAWYMGLLEQAALRGVSVRLVVDADFNDIPPEVEERLMSRGVWIKEFHPRGTGRVNWLNRRMHDKSVIVDDRQLITGSRNIRDSHFGLAKRNYVDHDVYLCGDVAAEARRYFDCLWASDEVRWTDYRQTFEQWRRQRQAIRSGEIPASGGRRIHASQWLAAGCNMTVDGLPIACQERDWCSEACPVACVTFLYDPCGVKGEPCGISRQLLGLLASAQASIILETPYFVMSCDEKQALAAATARGAHVTLLTNSLASTDHTTVTAEFHNQKHWLLSHGVEIWELAGPDHLHAKTAVVDGTIAYVGTYNFDPRSESLNTEVGVIVRDAAAADWVLASIGEHLGRAYPFDADGRSLADGSRHPGARCGRILLMQPLRVIAPLLRRSL